MELRRFNQNQIGFCVDDLGLSRILDVLCLRFFAQVLSHLLIRHNLIKLLIKLVFLHNLFVFFLFSMERWVL